ncbi:MAG: hypothetical protein GXP16_09280 [Gammaproteobacteria bacterium]|nr:hypothetical protein [Gammaproteobacteria bacterium]
MNKAILITAAVAVGAASASAQAGLSTPTEFRGYTTCIEAASEGTKGLVAARDYLINKSNHTAHYFINATVWNNGQREAVRISCNTAGNGQRLVSTNLDSGRFTQSSAQVRVEVAQN